MECQLASYLTRIWGSLLIFGNPYRQLWELNCRWVPHITLRRMASLRGRSNHWRICSEHVYWIIWVVGVKCFHWWNLPTTTAIIPILVWRPMRPCTSDDAGHHYVGIRMVSPWCWLQNFYSRPLIRSKHSRSEWEWLRVDRSPMQIRGGDL